MTNHWDKYNEGKHDFAKKDEMTDAEKALEDMHPWMPEEEYQIIRAALQRAADCEKVMDIIQMAHRDACLIAEQLRGEKDLLEHCNAELLKKYMTLKDDLFEVRERDKAATNNYNLMREHLERRMQGLVNALNGIIKDGRNLGKTIYGFKDAAEHLAAFKADEMEGVESRK